MKATSGPYPVPAIAVWRARPQLALLLLLLGEVLYLTITFDTQALEKASSSWTLLVGWSSQYLRLATAIVVVLLLPGGAWLMTAASDFRDSSVSPSRAPFLAAHAFAFVVFAAVTRTFFAASASVVAHPGLWTALWCLSGAATFVSWATAVDPQLRWGRALVQRRAVIAWGLGAGTMVWAAGFVTEAFWVPLARYTFTVVTWMLGGIFPQTVSDPGRLVVGTPAFKVAISPQCSGYEGVGLILAFLTIYLLLFRKELRFPGALVLLPIGAVTIWILNAVRIVILVAIGTAGWRTIAIGGFHSQAGWLVFNAVGIGFVAIVNRGSYFTTRVALRSTARREPDSTAAYLGPFVALLAAAMVTAAFSAGFDWLYGVRVIVVAAVLWTCRQAYAGLDWTCSWGACAIGVGTFVLWIALFPAGLADKAGWPAALASVPASWAAAWLAIRLVGYVIAVPVAEELAFRVYAMRRAMRSDIDSVPVGAFSWSSFVISSLLFGAFHGALWLQGTIAGMAFAWALCRRRSVGDAVLAHVTTNALIAIFVLVTGRWSVWS